MTASITVDLVPVAKVRVGKRFRGDMGDLSELVESIREKGLINPITLDSKLNLLAGERRLRAAIEAGLVEVPCIRRRSDGHVDALEIELYENIYRKDFTWQERAAAEKRLLEYKKETDPEWSIRQQANDIGVSKTAVARRIELASAIESFPDLANAGTEDEAWKAYKKMEETLLTDALVNSAKAKALKGVKIAQSNYKIGNALEEMTKLHDQEYHFAEVDPPYAVELHERKSRNKSRGNIDSYTEWTKEEYSPYITELAHETYRVLQPNAFAVWWFGMSWYTETLAILREAGWKVSDIPAIWTKSQGQTASPDTMLGSAYEPFFVCRKGDAKLAKPGRSNVFDFTPLAPAKKIHGTEKPLDLMVDILETFTFPGTRLVVPLLGSGVTLRACYKTGRIGFGWDLSKEHRNAFLAKVMEDDKDG